MRRQRRGRMIRNPSTGQYVWAACFNAVPDTVYFARCGDYVKIGATSDVTRRIATLNTPSGRANLHCPPDLPADPLVLIGSIPGSRDLEFTVHCQLHEYQVTGEWFRADPALLAWIAEQTERAA